MYTSIKGKGMKNINVKNLILGKNVTIEPSAIIRGVNGPSEYIEIGDNMFKGNMSKLLKQAQDVQQQIEKVQSQLSDMIIESESGGGMVKVKVNGKQEVLELCIDESTLQEDKEVVEDLIVSAMNKALSKAQSDSQEKMNSVAGGMMGGLKIPGM